jgi:hypothetical protein
MHEKHLATSFKHLITEGPFDYISPSLRGGPYLAQDGSEIE